MIIFLTVICLCAFAYFYHKFTQLNAAVVEYQAKVSKDFDVISKYLLKLPTVDVTNDIFKEIADSDLRQCQIKLMIEDSKKEIIQMFEKERAQLELVRANRSKDTFKSLRVALASNGKEQDED